MGSDNDLDHHGSQIVKGKRTKRHRSSSSPFGFTVTDSSSSDYYSGDDDGCYYYYNNNNNNNSISFPTTSGEIYESTEEEEDMANCLIMLAQGDDRRPRKMIQENIVGDDNVQKLNTPRKLTAMVNSDNNNNNNNKAGLYVYECKTCNRCFPSFQALGGHRASHKKPKAATAAQEAEKKPSTSSSSPSVVAVAGVVTIKDDFNSDSPLHHHHHHHHKANKIHECSICGSVFTSGQALGGHMRRHRAAAPNTTTNNNNNNDISNVKPAAVAATTRGILPLDLNLPAPEDDHQFRFGSTQQSSSSLVFSATALVDCHY